MKLTKTLMVAAAALAFTLPMTASAQVGANEVIGSLQNVNGNVYVERGGQFLRAVEGSAVLPGDKVVAEANGSTNVNLTGCNGKFAPCNNFVSNGSMVNLNSGNYCGDLATLLPIGPNASILSAAANVPAGVASGPAIGTAFPTTTLLALLGAGAVAGGIFAIVDDNDDDDDDDDAPVSP